MRLQTIKWLLASAMLCQLRLDAVVFYATTSQNTLVQFDSATPQSVIRTVPITGLTSGERISSIDVRPANGQLIAVSSGSRIYRIDPTTGAATAIGSAPFTPALSGTTLDIDFNPTVDRVRLVTDSGQNLRLQPDTGVVAATDTNLTYATGDANAAVVPKANGAAYTNSFAGSTTTTLYVIDTALGILARQGSEGGAPVSPNTGQLFTIGRLGVTPVGLGGFDISRFGSAAYAVMQTTAGGPSNLYSISLTTGAATLIGAVGSNLTITSLAISELVGASPECNVTGTPALTAVVNAASFQPGVSSNSLATAYFSGAASLPSPMAATMANFVQNLYPVELGCVAVEVAGERAPVLYSGSGQVNFQVPTTSSLGPVGVRLVLNPGRPNEIRSAPLSVNLQSYSPGLFTFNGRSVAAQATDFSIVANPAVVTGGQPTQAGNVISIYGTGFGSTNPLVQAGASTSGMVMLRDPVTITIGGVAVPQSDILYAGLAPTWISGLVQINVRVPQNVGAGDVPVVVSVGGVSSQTNVTLPVR